MGKRVKLVAKTHGAQIIRKIGSQIFTLNSLAKIRNRYKIINE